MIGVWIAITFLHCSYSHLHTRLSMSGVSRRLSVSLVVRWGRLVVLGVAVLMGPSALAPASRLLAFSVLRFSSRFRFVSLGLAAPLHTSSLDPGRHLTQANVRRGFLAQPSRGGGHPPDPSEGLGPRGHVQPRVNAGTSWPPGSGTVGRRRRSRRPFRGGGEWVGGC